MKNKITILFVTLAMLITGNIFAQSSVPCTNLTDADVKNLVKNFDKIYKDASKLESNVSAEMVESFEDCKRILNGIPEFTKILDKYGVSGNNKTEKFIAFVYSMVYISTKAQFDQNKELMQQYKAQGIDVYAQLDAIKVYVNDQDLKAVQKYSKQVIELVNNLD